MIIQNFASGFLASAITAGQTSLVVNPGSTLPTTNGLFVATLWNNSAYTNPSQDPNAEVVWCQYASVNTYTITRAQEGTAAVAHAAGSLMGMYITAGVLSIPYIKCSNTQASGTGGGAATTGAWEVMPLNTKDSDTASIATLASNQITLPAGTYSANAVSPFNATGVTQTRLYNVTASAVLLNGSSLSSGNGNSTILGQFTLLATSIVEIQYQAASHTNNNDLGGPASYGTEVYAIIELKLVNT